MSITAYPIRLRCFGYFFDGLSSEDDRKEYAWMALFLRHFSGFLPLIGPDPDD